MQPIATLDPYQDPWRGLFNAAAKLYRCRPHEIRSKKQNTNLIKARQMCVTVAHKTITPDRNQIALMFRMTRANVNYSMRKTEGYMDVYEQSLTEYEQLCKAVELRNQN